jgi:hypothetical protein
MITQLIGAVLMVLGAVPMVGRFVFGAQTPNRALGLTLMLLLIAGLPSAQAGVLPGTPVDPKVNLGIVEILENVGEGGVNTLASPVQRGVLILLESGASKENPDNWSDLLFFGDPDRPGPSKFTISDSELFIGNAIEQATKFIQSGEVVFSLEVGTTISDPQQPDPSNTDFTDYTPVQGTTYRVFSDAAPIPEPSSFALFGIGTLGLLGCAWRRKK